MYDKGRPHPIGPGVLEQSGCIFEQYHLDNSDTKARAEPVSGAPHKAIVEALAISG